MHIIEWQNDIALDMVYNVYREPYPDITIVHFVLQYTQATPPYSSIFLA